MTLVEDERVNSKSERITKTELRETTFKEKKSKDKDNIMFHCKNHKFYTDLKAVLIKSTKTLTL